MSESVGEKGKVRPLETPESVIAPRHDFEPDPTAQFAQLLQASARPGQSRASQPTGTLSEARAERDAAFAAIALERTRLRQRAQRARKLGDWFSWLEWPFLAGYAALVWSIVLGALVDEPAGALFVGTLGGAYILGRVWRRMSHHQSRVFAGLADFADLPPWGRFLGAIGLGLPLVIGLAAAAEPLAQEAAAPWHYALPGSLLLVFMIAIVDLVLCSAEHPRMSFGEITARAVDVMLRVGVPATLLVIFLLLTVFFVGSDAAGVSSATVLIGLGLPLAAGVVALLVLRRREPRLRLYVVLLVGTAPAVLANMWASYPATLASAWVSYPAFYASWIAAGVTLLGWGAAAAVIPARRRPDAGGATLGDPEQARPRRFADRVSGTPGWAPWRAVLDTPWSAFFAVIASVILTPGERVSHVALLAVLWAAWRYRERARWVTVAIAGVFVLGADLPHFSGPGALLTIPLLVLAVNLVIQPPGFIAGLANSSLAGVDLVVLMGLFGISAVIVALPELTIGWHGVALAPLAVAVMALCGSLRWSHVAVLATLGVLLSTRVAPEFELTRDPNVEGVGEMQWISRYVSLEIGFHLWFAAGLLGVGLLAARVRALDGAARTGSSNHARVEVLHGAALAIAFVFGHSGGLQGNFTWLDFGSGSVAGNPFTLDVMLAWAALLGVRAAKVESLRGVRLALVLSFALALAHYSTSSLVLGWFDGVTIGGPDGYVRIFAGPHSVREIDELLAAWLLLVAYTVLGFCAAMGLREVAVASAFRALLRPRLELQLFNYPNPPLRRFEVRARDPSAPSLLRAALGEGWYRATGWCIAMVVVAIVVVELVTDPISAPRTAERLSPRQAVEQNVAGDPEPRSGITTGEENLSTGKGSNEAGNGSIGASELGSDPRAAPARPMPVLKK